MRTHQVHIRERQTARVRAKMQADNGGCRLEMDAGKLRPEIEVENREPEMQVKGGKRR